uniref:UDP-galactose transporter n=1 Tax=Cyclophora tenuis TaxID=216820 RepID=A0A7S1D9C7_CYCTE|mmetsp:Transcript_3542/g.6035  ORF Transcript_3542/g.6035 Transcript_3542/m.6035 type:complete len:382 (+) Transcript_3542:109-1254(+)
MSDKADAEATTPPAAPKAPTNETMASNDKKSFFSQGGFRFLLLCFMVAQNSSTVLVSRYLRSAFPKEDQFNVNHLVCVTEIAKLLLSCLLEFHATNGGLVKSIKENILDAPMDALKISVPALLYLIQNTLLYVAISNLAAPLFQVTYQGKLVTTAIVSVMMLNRKYAVKQWICLVALSLGVAVVVLAEKKDDDSSSSANTAEQSLVLGLTCVTISCVCSALAGVYFEKVLKKKVTDTSGATKAPVSMWMRNVQLAFFSIVIAVAQGLGQGGDGEPKPYLHGFSFWAWILVGLQAGGGLLVAAVIKYADNVLKGLATGVSVVVATSFSMVFFDTPLTGQFAMGAVMILISVYFFSNDLPAACVKKSAPTKVEDSEMKTILPK